MLSKIIEIVFPCFFFGNKLLETSLVIHLLYSKNGKKSMRWEKSALADSKPNQSVKIIPGGQQTQNSRILPGSFFKKPSFSKESQAALNEKFQN